MSDKDRLKIILEKAIKQAAENNPTATANFVALLEPICDAEIPNWRDTYDYA